MPPEPLACADCGAAEYPGEQFRRSRWRRRPHCPSCRSSRQRRGLRRDLLALAALLALAHATELPLAHAATAIALNLAMVPFALAVGVLLHESAHALAARALGFEVHAVRIGGGRLRRAFRFAGLRWELCGWPDAGLIVATRTDTRGLAPRLLGVVGAGPVVTVLTACGLAWAAGPPPQWIEAMTSRLAPLEVALFAHLLLCAACLVPWAARSGAAAQPSDLLLALTILASPAGEADRHAQGSWAVRAEWKRRSGDVDAARALLERGSAEHPGSFVLAHERARLGLERGRWSDVHSAMRALLSHPEACAPPVQRLVRNNAAFAAALTQEPARVEEARRESLEVLLAGAPVPAFVGTHALLLVRSGLVAEGAAMAARLEREATDPETEAGALAVRAMAATASGDRQGAGELIDRALRADPRSLLARIAREELEPLARVA